MRLRSMSRLIVLLLVAPSLAGLGWPGGATAAPAPDDPWSTERPDTWAPATPAVEQISTVTSATARRTAGSMLRVAPAPSIVRSPRALRPFSPRRQARGPALLSYEP